MVLPTLAVATTLNEAIVLQQIHYWLDPRGNKNIKDKKHWVYNSYKDWERQFPFWSQKTIERIVVSLENRGILISKQFNKSKGDKTKWYTINYEKLNALNTPPLRQVDVMGHDTLSGPSRQVDVIINKETETTTENTNSSLNPSSKDFKKLGEEKKDIFEEKAERMLEYWNKAIREGRGDIVLDMLKQTKLLKALEEFFKGSVDEWKSYCKKISSSKFLMGETESEFKINLEWALKEEVIQKIRGEGYTLGDRETWPVEIGEEEKKELQKNLERARNLLGKNPDYWEMEHWEKGLKTYFFLYVKNLGEGRDMQLLLKKEGLNHPKIQDLFEIWKKRIVQNPHDREKE